MFVIVCGQISKIKNPLQDRDLSDRACLSISIAIRINAVIKNALIAGMEDPDNNKYKKVPINANTAHIFFVLYRSEKEGNRANKKRNNKNIKPAIKVI